MKSQGWCERSYGLTAIQATTAAVFLLAVTQQHETLVGSTYQAQSLLAGQEVLPQLVTLQGPDNMPVVHAAVIDQV